MAKPRKPSESFSVFAWLSSKNNFKPSSPVPRLITCNDPPSDIERRKIEESISVVRQRQQELAKQLANETTNTGSRSIKIQNSLREIDAFLVKHRAILSQLRCLPPEILSLIFTLCIEPSSTHPFVNYTWNTLPAFSISQVCRLWRDVALDTPYLWSMLSTIHLSHKAPSLSSMRTLNTILQRSRDQDLWIDVHSDHDVDAHLIMGLLVIHARRWCGVALNASPRLLAALSGIKNNLPRLRCLYLDFCSFRTPGDEDIAIDCFSFAPALREVHLRGSHPGLELPWTQLEVLGNETVEEHRDEFRDMLRYAKGSHLQRVYPGLPVAPLRDYHVTLPTLKSLSLKFPAPQFGCLLHPDFLLDILTLPSLEELHLSNCPRTSSKRLMRLVLRSNEFQTYPSLNRLQVDSSPGPLLILPLLLRQSPNLVHLEIEMKNLWQILPDMQSQIHFIPELKYLIVHWDKNNHLDFGRNYRAINDLAESRCEFFNRRLPSSQQLLSLVPVEGKLTYFLLSFDRRETTLSEQTHLNCWDQYLHLCYGDGWIYNYWERSLQQLLSELDKGNETRLKRHFCQWLDRILTEVENMMEYDLDVGHLYASKLHFSILDLTLSNKLWNLEGTDNYCFRERATRIIKTWSRAIHADTSNVHSPFMKKWVLKGERCLQYIPAHHDIRTSPQSSQLIWGFYQNDYTVIPQNIADESPVNACSDIPHVPVESRY